jgi:hypothetical protein
MTALTDPTQIEQFRWITVRAALRLEIRTGMKQRGRAPTTLQLATEITGVPTRSKAAAYAALNAKIVEALGPEFDRPL